MIIKKMHRPSFSISLSTGIFLLGLGLWIGALLIVFDTLIESPFLKVVYMVLIGAGLMLASIILLKDDKNATE